MKEVKLIPVDKLPEPASSLKNKRDKLIIDMRLRGYTLREISSHLNMYKTTVFNILRKKGVIIPKKPLPIELKNLQGRDVIREMVRIRDSHMCQSCWKKWKTGERRFDVHHLQDQCGKNTKGYDKRENIPNMITLCHKCHFNHPEHSKNKKK